MSDCLDSKQGFLHSGQLQPKRASHSSSLQPTTNDLSKENWTESPTKAGIQSREGEMLNSEAIPANLENKVPFLT